MDKVFMMISWIPFPVNIFKNPTLKFEIGNPSVWNDKVVYRPIS